MQSADQLFKIEQSRMIFNFLREGQMTKYSFLLLCSDTEVLLELVKC